MEKTAQTKVTATHPVKNHTLLVDLALVDKHNRYFAA